LSMAFSQTSSASLVEDIAALFQWEPEETKTSDEENTGSSDDSLPPPSPLDYAFLYRQIDGRPFSLDYDPKNNRGFEPLRQIFNDKHPDKVIKKPAQKALSTLAVTLTCHTLDVGAKYYGLDKTGLNVLYVFSTLEAMRKFSKERFTELLGESERLANLFTKYNDVTYKQAGESILALIGGKSTASMKSFAADSLILDEYDEILKTIIAMAYKRLKNSDLKLKLRLSTPTFPNVGIDAAYLESDQNVWEVQCEKCGDWNELDFFRDVYADGEPYDVWKDWEKEQLATALMHVACPSCHEEINTFGPGRWTPRRPEIKRVRGYYIPPLSCGKVDLNELAVNAVSVEPEEVQEFFRSDLGLAYEPKGARITDEMLKQLSVELPGGRLPEGVKWTNTTMGIDPGAIFRVRISSTGPDGKRIVRLMKMLRSTKEKTVWEQCSELMTQYNVRNCVIDMQPELNAAAEWAAKHKGRVLRAYYPTTATALKGRLFRRPSEEPDDADTAEEQEANTVQVNRTMAMDMVYNNIALLREYWPASIHNDPNVAREMKAPIRVLVKDKEGKERATWVHTQRDDYFHTCVYDVIAQHTLPKPTGFVGSLPYTGD
jgi:hypothetical protein